MTTISVPWFISWSRYDSPNIVDHAICSRHSNYWSISKNNFSETELNTLLNFAPIKDLHVLNICANFHQFQKIHIVTFLMIFGLYFHDHDKENVGGKHTNDETNQILTICLMSTNVPQYKTSTSIIISHSCLVT